MTNNKNIYPAYNLDFEICRVTAPLNAIAAWQLESFLLKIFEYGDYSFRAALRGEYSQTLSCRFFLAKRNGKIIGAAGCLYAHENPVVTILGPIAVAGQYRRNGVAIRLLRLLINHLKLSGCAAVYLAVTSENPAINLYKKLGFEKYKGIVMRLLLCKNQSFEEEYFRKRLPINIMKIEWGNWPAIMALATFPATTYSFNYQQNIFSGKYVEPTRFLSVFPEMMKGFAKYGGLGNALVTGSLKTIVGITHITRLPGPVLRHIAELDFYTHDNFVDHAEFLVRSTLKNASSLSINKITCYCLACDHLKRNIIESLRASQIAVLPSHARINEKDEDVLIYQFGVL